MAYSRGISSLEFLHGHCETCTCHHTASQRRHCAEDGCLRTPVELSSHETFLLQALSEEGGAEGRAGRDVGVAEAGHLASFPQQLQHTDARVAEYRPLFLSRRQVNPGHTAHALPYPLTPPPPPPPSSIQHHRSFVPDQTPHAISSPHSFPTDPSYAYQHVLNFIYQNPSSTARQSLRVDARVMEGLVGHTIPRASFDDNSVELQQTPLPGPAAPVWRERQSMWGGIRDRVRREFGVLKETYETGPWEWHF